MWFQTLLETKYLLLEVAGTIDRLSIMKSIIRFLFLMFVWCTSLKLRYAKLYMLYYLVWPLPVSAEKYWYIYTSLTLQMAAPRYKFQNMCFSRTSYHNLKYTMCIGLTIYTWASSSYTYKLNIGSSLDVQLQYSCNKKSKVISVWFEITLGRAK